jgi:two-component sensor histidine kinase
VKLHFNFKIKPAELNINQAIPLSIIISELFHNAARHAYPGTKEGRVDVSLKEIDEQALQLEIIDYGSGLSDTDIFQKPETMGFTVVKTLLSQIKAKAKIISGDFAGFGMRLRIPTLDKSGMSQSRRIPSIGGDVELAPLQRAGFQAEAD